MGGGGYGRPLTTADEGAVYSMPAALPGVGYHATPLTTPGGGYADPAGYYGQPLTTADGTYSQPLDVSSTSHSQA